MRQTEYPLIGSSIIAHGNLKCTYNVVMRGLESGNASSMQRFEILKRGKLQSLFARPNCEQNSKTLSANHAELVASCKVGLQSTISEENEPISSMGDLGRNSLCGLEKQWAVLELLWNWAKLMGFLKPKLQTVEQGQVRGPSLAQTIAAQEPVFVKSLIPEACFDVLKPPIEGPMIPGYTWHFHLGAWCLVPLDHIMISEQNQKNVEPSNKWEDEDICDKNLERMWGRGNDS